MELTALLEGGTVLLVNLEVLDDFLGASCSFTTNLLVRATTAAGREQADGTQGNGASEQGTAINL